MDKKSAISELLSFIRVETCFFISGIGIAGYAMFNRMDVTAVYLFLALFLGSGASYGYNHLTDKEEDRINNKRLNYFVLNGKAGKAVVASLFLSGLALAARLSPASFALFSLLLFLSAAYSGLKLKRMFIIKNVLTGATIALAFLTGSLVSGESGMGGVMYLPFVFVFGLTLNILGDIRGCEGDMKAGVRTIPVLLGTATAKKVVYLLTFLFAASVLVSGLFMLLPLVPFMAMISFFLSRDDHAKSRAAILASFVFFSVLMVMLNIIGGV
jgi:4-hydroxybenzoate polyprenyltransferase